MLMLSDKINRLPISRVDSPPINTFDEQNAVILINKQGNILSFEHSRRNSGAVTNRDRSESSTAQPSKPVAYNLKNVPAEAEVERRRAELADLARAAEARAKEAEEKCEQAEGRLEQELKERLLAEGLGDRCGLPRDPPTGESGLGLGKGDIQHLLGVIYSGKRL